MEESKVCLFFGHRTIDFTDELYAITVAEIEESVALGCRIFYFGGYSEFDELCHKIVTKLQAKRSDLNIRRMYCVPREKLLRKKALLIGDHCYEDVLYLTPKFDGWYRSIYFRNCAIIDHSQVIIFYAENRKDSGAYKAYRYAISKKGKKVINVFKKR